MTMQRGIAAAFVLALLASMCLASGQAPVALPTDPDLAAYVGSTGRFQSRTLPETRNLSMAAWAAAFGPGETFDFAALMDRAYLELGLPDEDGWGEFIALDDNLTIHVHVTDRKSRLACVRVYEVPSGALIGTLQASQGGAIVQGTLSNDAEVRDYKLEIVSAGGALLSTLAVDLGKWDAVSWISVGGGFEPFCPAPIACTRYTPRGADSNPPGNDYFRITGDPRTAPGASSGTTYVATSQGCATMDVTNDSATPITKSPPAAYMQFVKKDVIHNSVALGSIKFGDPAAMTALQNLMASLTVRDLAQALSSVSFPPYSEGYAYWQPVFTGQVTAILAAPYERVRKGGSWTVLLGAIVPGLTGADFLSRLLVSAAGTWLQNEQNRLESKFRPGDVRSLGDVYSLVTAQGAAEARNLAPLLAPVTFQVQPSVSPSPPFTPVFSGTVELDNPPACTSPPPPGPANGGVLTFNAKGTATMQLAKGYRWKATGQILSPMGYTASTMAFQTPCSQTVVIPTTLTTLLQLNVFTRTPTGPGPALVKVKLNGVVVREGTSAPQPNGHYMVSLAGSPFAPGTYVIEATNPPNQPATPVTITVAPAVTQEATITLGPTTPTGPPP